MIENDKIKLKIKALLANAESEAKQQTNSGTGEAAGYTNFAASLAFAKKAQELATKYHLDLDELKNKQDVSIPYIAPEIGQSNIFNPFQRSNSIRRKRMYWFEELAKIIAKGYYCKAGVDYSGEVFLVGLDFDREICEMVFLNLAQVVNKYCPIELKKAKASVGLPSMKKDSLIMKSWPGDEVFEYSFHAGFREQIEEIYKKHKQETESISVKEYWDENISGDFSIGTALINNLIVDETAKEIGKRVGRVMAKKVGATKDEALNKQNQLIIQQKKIRENLGEGGEVYLLIDKSTSMCGDRLIEAKEGAIGYAIDAINQHKFAVGLIDFGSDSRHILSPNKDIENIREKINSIYCSGSTNMCAALQNAKLHLTSRTIRQVVCIITDGEPNDRFKTLQIAKNMKSQGIEIMAIGTSGANQQFLDEICSRKGLGLLTSDGEFRGQIRGMAGMLNA